MELFIENQKTNQKLPLILENNFVKSHDCAMLKIVLIETGSCLLSINNKPVVISAPALLCLNEKESFKVEKGTDFWARIIYFLPSLINSCFNIENIYWNSDCFPDTARLDHFYFIPFLDRNGSGIGQVNIGLITLKKLSANFDLLKEQMNNYDDSYWPCRNRSFLIQILFLIQHCSIASRKEPVSIDLPDVTTNIHDIILFLHLNYGRKVTIQELSKEFHTNRNTLNKMFKKGSGVSVIEYLIKLRINVACMLLRDTSLPISEIMERVGFVDNSYWVRSFKKWVGLTPTDYRKSQIFPMDR
ncbi:MAG TPA: AraC family transcriptional regulator [Bacillota bacterium]|nr:AraC family transcriptional regulator [Bacillota bacterium]